MNLLKSSALLTITLAALALAFTSSALADGPTLTRITDAEAEALRRAAAEEETSAISTPAAATFGVVGKVIEEPSEAFLAIPASLGQWAVYEHTNGDETPGWGLMGLTYVATLLTSPFLLTEPVGEYLAETFEGRHPWIAAIDLPLDAYTENIDYGLSTAHTDPETAKAAPSIAVGTFEKIDPNEMRRLITFVSYRCDGDRECIREELKGSSTGAFFEAGRTE